MRIELGVVQKVCNLNHKTFQRWRRRKPKWFVNLVEYPQKRGQVEFDVENLTAWFHSEGFPFYAQKIWEHLEKERKRGMRVKNRIIIEVCNMSPEVFRRSRRRHLKPKLEEFKSIVGTGIEYDRDQILTWLDAHWPIQADKLRDFLKYTAE